MPVPPPVMSTNWSCGKGGVRLIISADRLTLKAPVEKVLSQRSYFSAMCARLRVRGETIIHCLREKTGGAFAWRLRGRCCGCGAAMKSRKKNKKKNKGDAGASPSRPLATRSPA